MSHELDHTLGFERFVTHQARYETVLEASNGQPVFLVSNEISNPRNDVNWILLTAVAGNNPIGFIDIRYFPLTKIATLETSHLRHTGLFDAPYSQFRLIDKSGSDGFFVEPNERTRGVGTKLLEEAISILKHKKAESLTVSGAKDSSIGLYQKMGAEKIGFRLFVIRLA